MADLPEQICEVLEAAEALPAALPGIVGVALVGSWARAAGGPHSDVDLVVLTLRPNSLLGSTSWFTLFGDDVRLVRSEDFGLLQERRLRRTDGLEVEVGIGTPEWAATDPPDEGSARVVRDGMRIMFDPQNLLTEFADAVREML
jgi:predicted nucleotidyltransferase